ncbi:MAG: prepilin-type cleavage/methylation domain-containing protein [Alicyclobacillus sp.]|nr:prepilin-type cleavage/methylation domain-containing protein [Alicyclobacillus sp.]
MNRLRPNAGHADDGGGFTLVELLVYVVVAGVISLTGIQCGMRLVSHWNLWATTVRLVDDLRYVQALSEASSASSRLQLSRYTPEYYVYDQDQLIEHAAFSPGVGYVDGYLQMGSARIAYDAAGDAEVSGVIRLTDGPDTANVTLYMGSGLQVLGGLP